MDQSGEAFIRAAVHDLSNTFAGIQGILDLSDPALPLALLQRQRLEALLFDGFQVLQRTRHLALGTRPEDLLESGSAWRGALEQQVSGLARAFRVDIQILHQGDPAQDRWPGELLRNWALAVTRQVLPFFRPTPECQGLRIETGADAQAWQMAWHPVGSLPACFNDTGDAPKDISGFWAKDVGHSLGAGIRFDQGCIRARIPRF